MYSDNEIIIILFIYYYITRYNYENFDVSSNNINHEELNYDILIKLQKDINYIKKYIENII